MNAIGYFRVSTASQGRSGLGLESQRSAVGDLCAQRGWRMLDSFTEVESGAKAGRPELAAALALARLTGAALVIAKLDRLSRNAAFLLALRDSGVDFVAADMPDANSVTVGIMAVIAEEERRAISARTKAALAAAKARGAKLGNPNGAAALRRAKQGNCASRRAAELSAKARAETLRPAIKSLRDSGVTSLGALAAALNERQIRTPRGARWHPSSVANLLARLT